MLGSEALWPSAVSAMLAPGKSLLGLMRPCQSIALCPGDSGSRMPPLCRQGEGGI